MTEPTAASHFDLGLDPVRSLFQVCSPDAELSPCNGALRLKVRGSDPYFLVPPIAANLARSQTLVLSLDNRQAIGSLLKVYFITDQAPNWCEAQSVQVLLPAYDGIQQVVCDFTESERWRGQTVTLRIDIEEAKRGDSIAFHELDLAAAPAMIRDLVLPTIPKKPGEDFHLVMDLAGKSGISPPEIATELDIRGLPHPDRYAKTDSPKKLCYRLAARSSGLSQVTLSPIGPGLAATIEVLTTDDTDEEFSKALRRRGGMLEIGEPPAVAARMVPIVQVTFGARNGIRHALIPLEARREEPRAIVLTGRRRIQGKEIAVEGRLGPIERDALSLQLPWRFGVKSVSPLPVFNLAFPSFLLGHPGHPRGRKLACLPGVEMRFGAEPLSSFLPDPSFVTWPCVFLQEDDRTIAILYDETACLPSFMVPDSRSGEEANLFSLVFPPRAPRRGLSPVPVPLPPKQAISGLLLVQTGRPATTLLAVLKRLLPEEERPLPSDEKLPLTIEALETRFRGPSGMTLPNLSTGPEGEYFDPDCCLALLAVERFGLGSSEEAVRRMIAATDEGAGMPLDLALCLPEKLPVALAGLEEQACKLAATQRDDGTWPASHPPGCLLPDPGSLSHASATVAGSLEPLLCAWMLRLGPLEPIERSLAHLRRQELAPAGGQFWEFAPTVPEILGATQTAAALLLAYDAGLAENGLEEALEWLSLASTFIKLTAGTGFGACFPALGKTRNPDDGPLWFSHSPDDQLGWRGVSCPWVGLRFAASLRTFASHITPSSPEPLQQAAHLFDRLAREVIHHAALLQRPDGSIPDGFIVSRMTETEPLYRAPVDLLVAYLGNRFPRATYRTVGSGVVVGVGRFAETPQGLRFESAIPGPQAMLTRGAISLSQGGRRLASASVYAEVDSTPFLGQAPISIEPE